VTGKRADILILLGGLAVAGCLEWKLAADLEAARQSYLKESRAISAGVAYRIDESFRLLYHGLRTMARLPGVRSIDRHAANFDRDALRTAQEIYNNLASEISLSELYIVPADFDPDRWDPVTRKPEEPITTFDELIVGRQADRRTDHSAEPVPPIEEIEIYEYRLMRRQIDELRSQVQDEATLAELRYPAVLGPEVVTCDNTYYSALNPDDRDRSGLVYSVPFFSPGGEFKGIVSAVVLTRVIESLLPGEGYSVQAEEHQYVAGDEAGFEWRGEASHTHGLAGDPSRIYSEVIQLGVLDVAGDWHLLAARDDAEYWSRADVRSARFAARLGYAAMLSLCVALWCWRIASRKTMVRLRKSRADAEAANLAKSQFLANVSHEIRTPMTAVLGCLELLRDEGVFRGASEGTQNTLRAIERSGTFLLSLINDLLETTAAERGEIVLSSCVCNPVEIVGDVFQALTARVPQSEVACSMEVLGQVPESIESDPMRIQQIVQNLLDNAIKFTETGSVSLRVSAESRTQDSAELVLSIEDTGIGIAPEHQAEIFEAFHQVDPSLARRYGGLGLGLSITARVVRALGGRIDVTSALGEGSAFRVRLPVRVVRSVALRVDPQPPVATLEVRILLAEDSPDNQRLISRVLERAGATVEVVENGRLALDRVLEDPEAFDLILMDMQMPEIDGYEATRRLREAGVELPIIALTAHAMARDREICLAAGCNDYASKPVKRAKLIELVTRWATKR